MSQMNTQTAAAAAAQDAASGLSLLEYAAANDKQLGDFVKDADSETKSALGALMEVLFRGDKVIDRNLARAIDKLIANIDQVLSEQISLILHAERFQKVEGTWRGLKHMISNVETGVSMKVRVCDITKDEVSECLEKYEGTLYDQSPIYNLLFREGYGKFGGEPVAAIVGDYEFDHSSGDVKILEGMGTIACAAHAPFLSAVKPSLFGIKSWDKINDKANAIAGMDGPKYGAWNSLRASDDARYLALTMPRYMAREPYGEKKKKLTGEDAFAFEEDTSGQDSSKYTWSNAAFALGKCVLESFDNFGWCSEICGVNNGGRVEGLPMDTHENEEGLQVKMPTEVFIYDKLENLLSRGDPKNPGAGVVPLSFRDKSDYAVFFSAQTLHRPGKYSDPDDQANARLSCELRNIMACSRFAHYLKAMARDRLQSSMETTDVHKFLSDWITDYVEPDPNATEVAKAKRPLAAASVEVTPVPGAPGEYNAKFKLRPHFKLQSLDASMSLVSRLERGQK